ncbi:MAG: hypothetical protein IH971_06170 [Candidatus Marinimicrobia bacterium]|nr:hypothetical protein [Candidatus Neomarinimicrobiota bacterium]
MRYFQRRRPESFRRLRTVRWSTVAIWRYLALLILVLMLVKFLISLG